MLHLKFFLFSEYYQLHYEKTTIVMIVSIIVIKIIYDWVKETYGIILSSVLIVFLTTLNLNLSVVFVAVINFLYFLMIMLRFFIIII